MSVIIGFDLSSRKLAAFELWDNRLDARTFEADGKLGTRPEVLESFLAPLIGYFGQFRGETFWVFVEQPLVGRGGAHATIVQAQVQGIVLALAVQSGAAGVYPVNVQTWKKAVVGHGGANKALVRAWLEANFPSHAAMAGEDQDLVDAACVALYGRGVIGRGRKLKNSLLLDT